ncbi:hypothetical protein Tco_0216793, partial [Tanacetum coccineum]
MGGTLAQTRSERVPEQPNEPPLSEGHTSGSEEGRMEQTFELTNNVLDLEKEKDAQAETVDAATTGVSSAAVTISTTEPRTPPSSTTVFDDEDVTMAMAQTLIKMKEQTSKEKGVAITDVEDSSRTVRPLQQEEREQFTIEEREQFLVETIAAQRKFRAAQRAAKIRIKPPTKTQVRNLMITYLKNTVSNDIGKKNDSSSKLAGGSRKKTLARKRAGEKKSEESNKK